jgi:hypothetical protein
LEPREADVVMNIFKKDLNIKGLTQLLVVWKQRDVSLPC